jgi:hypothetical protein
MLPVVAAGALQRRYTVKGWGNLGWPEVGEFDRPTGVNSQDFDFLVVVAPKPSAMEQFANDPAARREQRFTAYVIPVGEVQAKSERSLMRSPLRDSAYEWAWESVIDYLHLS